MPEITLSLPAALGLMVLLLAIGAALVFGAIRLAGDRLPAAQANGPTATITPTPTLTLTPTIAFTSTPVPDRYAPAAVRVHQLG